MTTVDSLLASLTVKIAGDTADFEKALASAGNQVRDFGKKINSDLTKQFESFDAVNRKLEKGIGRLGESIASVGKGMSAAITLPIAAATAIATKSAIDFETAFTGVKKTLDVTGLSAEQTQKVFSELASGIRQMAKEIPASTTEISKVAEAAGQLGIKRDAILEFTRVMVDLGNTTNLSAETAATALARLANITQLPQDQFKNLGSTIVALGNNLATTEAEITEMALRLAGAGNQIGLTQAEILSFGAALSSVGIEAEAGGTAFSTVFKKIQIAVESGGEDLANFAKVAGVSADTFKNEFGKDASGTIIKFIEGLGNIKKAGGSTFQTLAALDLKDIRVSDALLRAANAGDLMRKSIELGNQAWTDNNALTNEANQRYQTTASQIQIAKNKLNDLGITIGNALLPFVTGLTNFIGGLADSFANLSPTTQRLIIVLAGVAAAIGPLLIAFGAMASASTAIIATLSTVGLTIGGLLGPIALVVAAVAALSLAFAATAAGSNQAVDSWQKQKAAVDGLEKNFSPLIARYEELKAKSILTQKEQSELNDVIQKIGKQVPTAITAFDEYGRALDINSDKAKEFVKQQQAILKIKNKEALEEQTDSLKTLERQISSLQAKLKSGISFSTVNMGGVKTEFKLSGDEITKLQAKLADLQNQKLGTQGLIDELSGVQKQTAATTGTVEALAQSTEVLDNSIKSTNTGLSDQQKALEKYKSELQSLINQQALFGDSFNFAGEKAQLLQKSLVDLMQAGFSPQSALIQGLKKELDALNAGFEQTKKLIEGITTIENPIVAAAKKNPKKEDIATPDIGGIDASTLVPALDGVAQRLAIIKQAGEETAEFLRGELSASFASFGEVLGTAFASGDKGLATALQGLLGMLADFAIKFGKQMIAIGIAMNIAAPGSGVARMIGGALIVAAGTAAKAIKIPALANGGITTGPTLALIGEAGREAVIPLNKLDEIMGNGGNGNGTVEFIIKGGDLYGTLDRYNSRKGRTS